MTSIANLIERFATTYGKSVVANGTTWRYYRVGKGAPLLFFPGGLRRAAHGFAVLEHLASAATVIAIDYPPVMTAGELARGVDAILQSERIDRFAVAGQSYGGLIAQAVTAIHGDRVDRLIVSGAGPADYARAVAPFDRAAAFVARIFPAFVAKNMIEALVARLLSTSDDERRQWRDVVRDTLEHDLTRADAISHFALIADIIQQRIVRPEEFAHWNGRVFLLIADNEVVKRARNQKAFERLFGRPVEIITMRSVGHTAAFTNPDVYATSVAEALAV
ncbi:MAG TPA: alpha/beta hydrolase [Thermoanaerobaculia bacterium]